jgi:hypothetical protein
MKTAKGNSLTQQIREKLTEVTEADILRVVEMGLKLFPKKDNK